MEQYTHQDPQPTNKAKMRNVLEHNKLEFIFFRVFFGAGKELG
jgi:hypothetical protein